ncbi:hypothetical protein [Portibacter marinus]|uniref:hypothetical protein n=1 Tax=Portibacter marinus TaxID=2898660 RepID=UPI001F1F0A06|nr:hypothetical protein [Portibacter marinus]
MRFFSLLILSVLLYSPVNSQVELSNIRLKNISLSDTIIQLDTLSIVPSSLRFFNNNIDITKELSYHLDHDRLIIRPQTKALTTTSDSIKVMYRVFPVYFGTPYSHLDSTKVLPKPNEVYIGYDYDIYQRKEPELLFSRGLEYDGSFSRGLSFGNSQSLVLNSSFNLQLGGKLSDDLEILASISDANIPIQPEGTTQQLQDFDKVFIQLKRKNTTLLAGDYEISRPNSYFINYYKKLQGVSVIQENDLGKFGNLYQKGSAAISRGKFSRNILDVAEGNQGPYKLTGSEGERFLIVLSGTEKVYFDGRLMTRGEENDYVIYYDRAEIVFTTNRLITKDSRIIVEFEYADQRYLRSLYQYSSTYTKDKLQMDFNVVSQQDSRNTTGNIELDSLDFRLLDNAGDSDESAVRSGIRRNRAEFSNNKIYYKKEFRPEAPDSVLVFTADPDSAMYQANFSDVGNGNGSYIINTNVNANGRVYKYVGPGQGNYEPFVRLVAPEQNQMYALRSHYQFNEDAHATAEIGMSYFDLNRFSSLDDRDNLGLSGRFDFEHKIGLGKNKNWNLRPLISMESKTSNFEAFNPYRNPEFIRDWNLDPNIETDEFLGNFGFRINQINNEAAVGYSYGNFTQYGFYEGHRHNVSADLNKGGFDVNFNNNYLTSTSLDQTTKFARPKINISKKFSKLDNWSVGYYGERERNEIQQKNADTLDDLSFLYDYSKFFLRSDDKDNFSFGVGFNQRNDYSSEPGEFTLSATANEYVLNGKWNVKQYSNSSWSFTYRELMIKDDELTAEQNNAVLLGNFNHILKLWKGAFNSTFNYKVSSGQEPKIEFDFREVLQGDGEYIWIDDGDGIQQRNEFQIAPYQDQANYVRVSLFNNEFIRTNNNGLTQSLRIDPKIFLRSIKEKQKWHQFASRWSLISNYRVDAKNRGSKGLFEGNQFSINDTSLVSYSSLYNGILFFNKGNPAYDIQLGIRNNKSKVVQTLGFEQRGFEEYYLRNRIAASKNIDVILVITRGERSLVSEIYSNNDFALEIARAEPQLTYRVGNSFRLNMEYTYERKVNIAGENNEKAMINDVNFGVTYAERSKSRIMGEIKYANVNYTGQPNTALELSMLDGLKDGRNVLWSIDYSRRIRKNIDVSISYEGRKTGDRDTVHVGRAQVKSSF